MLGCAVTLLGSSIKLFGKLAVDRSKVDSVSVLRALALFHRTRTVVIGIVRHEGKTTANHVGSVSLGKVIGSADFSPSPPLKGGEELGGHAVQIVLVAVFDAD